ncbi:hypothetical protein ACH5RR_036592, partial [Cinchona calisaya]
NEEYIKATLRIQEEKEESDACTIWVQKVKRTKEFLDSGAQGSMCIGNDLESNEKVAIKIVSYDGNNPILESTKMEIKIMKELHHEDTMSSTTSNLYAISTRKDIDIIEN